MVATVPTQFTVPESSASPIGIVPMLSATSGGQSWLVGYEGSIPLTPFTSVLAGVHAMPLFVPPLQTPLFGTPTVPPWQSGQGWMPGTPAGCRR